MKKNYSAFSVVAGLSRTVTENSQKPRTSRFLNLHSVLGAFALLFGGAAYSQYQTIPVTGFTDDVIANGVGAANLSTNNNVDGGDFAFMANDFQATSSATAPAYALPTAGLITSAVTATTGLTYQMAPFTGNNSLRLAAINSTGTLTVTTPVAASTLYVLATSGSAISNFTVTINFADGTTQVATAQAVPDWFNSTALPVAASGFGRINRATNALENPSGNPRLYQLAIDITAANQSKNIQSVLFTKTAAAGYLQIFALSKKEVPACPVVGAVTATTSSFTGASLSWTMGSFGAGASTATYTVEVYTDATFTTHVAGSPFTGVTAATQVLTGLTLDATYYYRVKANNGTCESPYVTGNFVQSYCTANKTGTSTSYYMSNVATTGGYTNISNNTGTTIPASGYTNFAATQIVSKPAGTSFNYTITRVNNSTSVGIWVDWNDDLDFSDDNEQVAIFAGGISGPLVINGTLTIPAGTALGNHRMRIRSLYYLTGTVAPCGGFANGEAEDYTITVVAAPADCIAPDAPTITATATGATINGTVTAPATAPTGYILVRSLSATLTAQPQTGASYAVGAALGGGVVIASGATLTTFSNFVGANTRYYYFAYAYNENGNVCFGPKYSVAAVANAVTCAKAVQVASASNITHIAANLNWSNIVGLGGVAATYTVEVYTNAALTALFGTFTSTTNSYALTGLTSGASYWYRVKGEAGDCDNDAWSAASTFTAQNSFTPIDVTGFNQDVIANGTGIANVSSNAAVDAVNNAYVALDYERVSGTVTTAGLPLNRTLGVTTPAAVAGLNFLLADYSGNNALRLPAQNQSGTLTLATPRKFTSLYLSLTSGSGGSTISAVVQFQDGTSQAAANFTLIDWYQAGTTAQPALISNIGRVNRTDNTGAIETGNSKIFYVTIPIEAANQGKSVSAIVITKTSTGATEPVPNIFSVSGKAADVCPVLVPGANSGITGQGATFNWTLDPSSPAVTSYTVEVYTDATYTTHVPGSPFTGITATTYTVTGLNPSTPYFFRVKGINSDCTSGYFTGSFITSCVTPAAPTATAQALCGNATVSQLTATGVLGATIKWYETATSTVQLAGTTAITSGVYFVSQTISTCESPRTPVTVTVNNTAAPTASAQSFCGSATVSQLQATILTGATVTWSTTQNGAALDGTAALATGTYYVKQTLNGCTSTAVSVAVTVTAVPAAPAAAAQTFCGSTTVAQLTATGVNGAVLSWSATEGGTALTGTAAVTTGTYYVTQTVNGCTSTATAVTVTVNAIPAAPATAAQSFCTGATAAELDATGTALVWSATQGGAALTGTETLVTGTYYVTQTVNGCVSPAATVAVTVNAIPAAPVVAAQTFCAGATVAAIVVPETTATYTWYTTEGGTALASTAVLATGTYYVTQTLAGCASVTTSVAITVNTTAAPVAAAQSFCGSATVADLEATTLDGAAVTWSATEGGAALEATAALATGTYYITQTLNGCASTTVAVTVTVTTPTVPGGADAQTFTEGETIANLDITPAAGATVTWYTKNDAGVYTEVPATTELEDGMTYYVNQSVNGCVGDYLAITVSEVAGVKGHSLRNLMVYPNPTASIVTLTNSDAITKVEVVNLLGQTVLTLNADSQTVTVDMARLAAGTYLVQVATANAATTVKVVKY